MNEKEALEWVLSHSDDDVIDPDELRAAFRAIYGRYADADDDIWSLCCASI